MKILITHSNKNVQVICEFSVFGAFALSAGVLALFLPETRNAKIPDSIEDAEQIRMSKACGRNK